MPEIVKVFITLVCGFMAIVTMLEAGWDQHDSIIGKSLTIVLSLFMGLLASFMVCGILVTLF